MDPRRSLGRRRDAVFDWAGLLVRDLVTSHHDPLSSAVLDVGVGYGKYRVLLHEYDAVDACEIWEPTVVDEDLRSLYRNVYVDDVFNVVRDDRWTGAHYDVVVMGDVLEHMTRERARSTLQLIYERCDDVIVVVPYEYPQGAEGGNAYQCHLQDDLTPELMTVEYPELRLVAVETRDRRPFKGLYRRSAS